MKKRILVLLLSIVLVLGLTVPVQAHAEDIQPIQPVSKSVSVSQLLGAAGADPTDIYDYHTSIDEVVKEVRRKMEARETVITVSYTTTQYSEQLMETVYYSTFAHTGVPTQGDYLRWQIGKCEMSTRGYTSGSEYYLQLSFTPEYYSTAQQEAQMDLAVAALLDQLDVYHATDYEKICAIYDYICNHVTYDTQGLAAGQSKLIYTAYAALINGKAVCQGYANLFYRLALELGVDTRLVAGYGNGEAHGWNIVKLYGAYYNLDATWDASRVQAGREYDYFLLCQAHFDDHVRNAEYLTETFQGAYPMADADFSLSTETLPGDVDGDAAVTRDDAIRVLLFVLNPSRFPLDAAADFNADNSVTRDDAIRLLLYVLNPNRFPLETQ